jgi:hypothetical protein
MTFVVRIRRIVVLIAVVGLTFALLAAAQTRQASRIGQEVSIPRHLGDDEEFSLPLKDLVEYGKKLFMANWTDQEGAGRPETKGNGTPLADRSQPLVGSRAWNRISGPDANSGNNIVD